MNPWAAGLLGFLLGRDSANGDQTHGIADRIRRALRAFFDRTEHQLSSSEINGLSREPERVAGPTSFVESGWAKIAEGDFEGAIADFNRGMQLSPERARIFYCCLGEARLRKGDSWGAIEDCNRSLRLDNKSKSAVMAYRLRGKANQSNGDLESAIADFDRAVQLDPSDCESFITRGLAKRVKGDLTGAILDLDSAIGLDPKNAAVYHLRGSAKKEKGHLDDAIADCNQAIALDPQSAPSYFTRGLAKERKGDLQDAVADYSRAIDADSRHIGAYGARGLAKLTLRDAGGCISDLDRAIELNPAGSETLAWLPLRGLAKALKGDLGGSIGDYNSALELSPDSDTLLLFRGMFSLTNGQWANAVTDFIKTRAVSMKEEVRLTASHFLWITRCRLGENVLADKELSEALATHPSDARDFEANTAAAALLLGRISEAEFFSKSFDPAGERPPEAAQCEAHYVAGMKRLVTGEKEAAIDHFRECVASRWEKGIIGMPECCAQAELKALGVLEEGNIRDVTVRDQTSKIESTSKDGQDSEFKLCPFCKEQIRQSAIKCRFCGEWIEPSEPDSVRKATTEQPALPSPTPNIVNPPPVPNIVNPPAPILVAGPKAGTLNIAIGADGNPSDTAHTIQEAASATYLLAVPIAPMSNRAAPSPARKSLRPVYIVQLAILILIVPVAFLVQQCQDSLSTGSATATAAASSSRAARAASNWRVTSKQDVAAGSASSALSGAGSTLSPPPNASARPSALEDGPMDSSAALQNPAISQLPADQQQLGMSPARSVKESTPAVIASQNAAPGERFPETRLRLLQSDEVKTWPQDKLRYAINEMFARHGAEFADQKIGAWFRQFSWYDPQPNVTFDQIEAAMPPIEQQNVKLLAYFRDLKRSNPNPSSPVVRSHQRGRERVYQGKLVPPGQ